MHLHYALSTHWTVVARVCNRSQRAFPSHLLTSTFALATIGNSLVAILSGVIAQYAVDMFAFVYAVTMLSLHLFFYEYCTRSFVCGLHFSVQSPIK